MFKYVIATVFLSCCIDDISVQQLSVATRGNQSDSVTFSIMFENNLLIIARLKVFLSFSEIWFRWTEAGES